MIDTENTSGEEGKISDIRNLDELIVDFSTELGFKLGDLSTLHTKSYRCVMKKDKSPRPKRLVLTRIDCLDSASYYAKIEEADKIFRFCVHPNVITLYSYWISPAENILYYKTLYLLFEECTVGDLNRCLVTNVLKPSRITVTKYICDLAKGTPLLTQVLGYCTRAEWSTGL